LSSKLSTTVSIGLAKAALAASTRPTVSAGARTASTTLVAASVRPAVSAADGVYAVLPDLNVTTAIT
jgi:hypothetical protein